MPKHRKAICLGSLVRRARLLRGWSQETLGLEVGVAQATIRDIEVGYNWPSVPVLARLCASLRVSADWLLAGVAREEASR
jgi:transcriptional regulator with XRE-family HTH domain